MHIEYMNSKATAYPEVDHVVVVVVNFDECLHRPPGLLRLTPGHGRQAWHHSISANVMGYASLQHRLKAGGGGIRLTAFIIYFSIWHGRSQARHLSDMGYAPLQYWLKAAGRLLILNWCWRMWKESLIVNFITITLGMISHGNSSTVLVICFKFINIPPE